MKAKILAGLFAVALFAAACTGNKTAESTDTLAADTSVAAVVDTNTVDTLAADSTAVVPQ